MERWRPIAGFEGVYDVSDHGQVRSLDRIVQGPNGQYRRCRGQLRSPGVSASGHLNITLSYAGEQQTRMLHHLVLETFVGPRPPGAWGLHGDDNPEHNHVSNLRWDAPGENVRDTVRHGKNRNAGKQRCNYGHKLIEPNLVACHSKRGHRGCLACNRARPAVAKAWKRGVVLDHKQVADDRYSKIMKAV